MRAKTKFLKIFNSLPDKSKSGWVWTPFENPRTMNVIALEVSNDTKLGKQLLYDMGYEED